jgi:hypothetical protein
MPRGTNPKAVDFIFNSGLAIRTARIGPTPGRTVHTISGQQNTLQKEAEGRMSFTRQVTKHILEQFPIHLV